MSKNITIEAIASTIKMLQDAKEQIQITSKEASKREKEIIDSLNNKHEFSLKSFKAKIEDLISNEVCKDKEIAKLKKESVVLIHSQETLALENKQLKSRLNAINSVDIEADEYVASARKKAKKVKEK